MRPLFSKEHLDLMTTKRTRAIQVLRLAENDLNRSGTPPAKKEAVAALPTVNIQERKYRKY
ncbi:hypothetical protein E2562_005348 [Oryza meyeriana var. granulata]|uniref:Uncharacterized protein n=1 Tax=Oryza meyeriana var. granulata TaxID=110450 RepID=A0A6G1DEM8_9ORYZ|nr:hypothetical protein E2562_005348 [Oryza meyeriana var. granulata]